MSEEARYFNCEAEVDNANMQKMESREGGFVDLVDFTIAKETT